MYAVFVGLLFVTFVGVGIATFYTAPKSPDYPVELQFSKPNPTAAETEEQKALQTELNAKQEAFQKADTTYNRTVSMIAIGFAVLFLIIGLVFATRLDIIADGLVLGGIFTLIYGIIRGMISDENAYRFAVTAISLVIAMVLGYIKFAKPAKPAKK